MGKRKDRHDAGNGNPRKADKYAIKEEEDFIPLSPAKRKPEPADAPDKKLKKPTLLEPEDRQYFGAIMADLRNSIESFPGRIYGSSSDTARQTDDNIDGQFLEEEMDKFHSILERVKGQEILIAKDKEISFLLENLLRLCGPPAIRQILNAFMDVDIREPGKFAELACHFTASHILETIFECAASVPVTDKSWKPVLESLHHSARLLKSSSDFLFEDTYGLHVMEKFLLRSVYITSYSTESGRLECTLYDPAENEKRPITINGFSTSKLPEASTLFPVTMDDKLLNDLFDAFEIFLTGGESGEGLEKRLLVKASSLPGSICMQTLILVGRILTSRQRDLSSRPVLKRVATFVNEALLPALTRTFEELIFNSTGARVGEMMICCSDQEAFRQLLGAMTDSEELLNRIASNRSAHRCLLAALQSCSTIEDLSLCVTKIFSRLETVILEGHAMLVLKAVQILGNTSLKTAVCGKQNTAAPWNNCQQLIMDGLKDFYFKHAPNGWKESMKKDYFVLLIGAFFPRNFSDNLLHLTKSTVMPGSQTIQALLAFKDTNLITGSLSKLEASVLKELCLNTYGSFLIDHILKTQRGHKNFYMAFVKNLTEITPEIAVDKVGSRVFDSLWGAVDLKQRELIVEKMEPAEQKLKANGFARFLLPRLNLNLFKRNRESWRTQQKQYQSQKDDLKDILEIAKKKVKV